MASSSSCSLLMEKISQGEAGLSAIDAILLDPALAPHSVRAFRDTNKKSLLTLAATLHNLGALQRLVTFFRASKEVVVEAGCHQSENLLLVALEVSGTPKGPEILNFVLKEIGRDTNRLDVAFKRLATENRSAVHVAAFTGRTEVFQALQLLEASEFKKRLLNDKESRDKNLQTPLHLAASKGHGDTVRALVNIAPELSSLRDALGETSLHKAIGVQSIDIVQFLLDIDPALIKIRNKKGKSPYQHALEIKEKARALDEIKGGQSFRTVGTAGRTRSFDDRMEIILKERTLRYPDLSFDQIRKLFYSSGRGPDLFLDLSEFNDSTMNFEEYLACLKSPGMKIEYDPCLKLVKLPDLSCSGQHQCKNLLHGLRSRPEALEVFNYLRSRGVTHTFEVNVPDCPIHPHTNRSIGECLRGLHVRQLDWRKKDLSVNILRHTVPKVQCLFLYSSGNADILSHWTGRDGLRSLEELQDITISISRGEDSDQELEKIRLKTENALKEIKTDDKDQRTDPFEGSRFQNVSVILEKLPPPAEEQIVQISDPHPKEEPATIFNKLELVTKFLRRFGDEKQQEECTYVINKPVKIAIIDSGIAADMFQNVKGASFLEDDVETVGQSHWHTVTNPHGTKMADIIRKMDPHCFLLVARAHKGQNKAGINVSAAINAIDWAVCEGADIISMSWSVSSENMKDVKLMTKLADAIHRASSKSLLFCATGDKGSSGGESQPAQHPTAFAICTSTIEGTKLGNAEENHANFFLPGENLEVGVPKYRQPKGKDLARGSSAATALAAGFASMILALVKFAYYESDSKKEALSAEYSNNDDFEEERSSEMIARTMSNAFSETPILSLNAADEAVSQFKQFTNMERIFKKLCNTTDRFVQPWNMFADFNKFDLMDISEAKAKLRAKLDELKAPVI